MKKIMETIRIGVGVGILDWIMIGILTGGTFYFIGRAIQEEGKRDTTESQMISKWCKSGQDPTKDKCSILGSGSGA